MGGSSAGGDIPDIGVDTAVQFQQDGDVSLHTQGFQIHDGHAVHPEVQTVESTVIDLLQCGGDLHVERTVLHREGEFVAVAHDSQY